MFRIPVCLSCLFFILGGLLLQPVLAANPLSDQWAPGRLLVKPVSGTSNAILSGILQRQNSKSQGTLRGLNIHVVSVPENAEDHVASALANNPNIEFAEKDFLVQLAAVNANDTHYDDAWHLPKIGAPDAWAGSLGNGVVVAVLDTGVESSHPDLQGQLLPGWNAYDNNADTSDVHGHGTMVSGTIAAASNNGIGVASVAWQAVVLPVRISLPNGNAYTSTIANGLTWAADNGADVANISYAVTNSSSVRNAADYLRSQGGLTFIAAGNDGTELTTYPYTSVITVSATSSGDSLTSWSNYGNAIDIAGPGSGIWTTRTGATYGAVSGTSFSSPLSAAVAALIMAANPALSPVEVENILFDSSTDLGTPGPDIYYGHGRINASAAVQAALATEGTPVDEIDPLVSINSPNGGNVSNTVNVAIDASDNVAVTLVELYANGSPVGSDNFAPFSVSWDTTSLADGPVQLVAYAHDAAGNTGVSTGVSVEVDNLPEDIDPPVITVVIPAASGATVSGHVSIEVEATDNVGVTSLEVFIDGQLKSSSSSGNASFRWNTRKLPDGDYELRSEASDAAGNETVSMMTLTVNNNGGDSGGDTGGDTGGGGGSFCDSRPNHKKCQ